MRWLDSITSSVDTNLSILLDIVEDKAAWHATAYGVIKSWMPLRAEKQPVTIL